MLDITDTHVFFYKEWPSNFKRCSFTYTSHIDNGTRRKKTETFFCTEQAFMWEKANYFGDIRTADAILTAATPMDAKSLGRQVKPFDNEKWTKVRYNIMIQVNLEKYRQNPDLLEKLLDPRLDGKTFVEASPVDGIWGILMPMGANGIDDEANWRGQNLLGKAITTVRKMLKP